MFLACSALLLLLPYHVCITPFLNQALNLHYVAATAKQQSQSKFVWTTSIRVLTLHIRV